MKLILLHLTQWIQSIISFHVIDIQNVNKVFFSPSLWNVYILHLKHMSFCISQISSDQ